MKKTIIISILALTLLVLPSINAIEETVNIEDYELIFDYSGAEEDDTFSLSVTVRNTNSATKQDIVFTFDPDDPFDVDGDEEWDVGNLGEDEEATRSFRIDVDDDTDEGGYDLLFTLEDSSDEFEDEVEIEVSSNKADLIIGDVKSVPSIIMADQEDVKLEVTIENIGGGDATFVRAKINLPKGVTASNSFSDTINLGSIESGGNKVAIFFIDTAEELDSGKLQGILELDFKSDTNKKSSRLNVDIPVKGAPLFNIVGSSVEPKITPGDGGKLSINIRNIGEEKGEETSVRVFENADHPFDFDEKTNFVGTLEQFESGTAVFDFDVDSSANPNNYLVKVQIRTLNKGNVIVSEHTVSVKVNEPEAKNFASYLLFTPIILVVLLIGMMVFKKRNKVETSDY